MLAGMADLDDPDVEGAFDAAAAARAVAGSLRPFATAERAVQAERYLKSDLEFLGVTVPDLRRAVKAAVVGYPAVDRDAAVAWTLALWRQPVHECRMAAVEVLRLAVRQLRAEASLPWRRLSGKHAPGRWWTRLQATSPGPSRCATRPRGTVLTRGPTDEDFWVRRSAILDLLPGIRAGQPDLGRFERYATAMLGEKEFFIRKAIGWVLHEASKRDPDGPPPGRRATCGRSPASPSARRSPPPGGDGGSAPRPAGIRPSRSAQDLDRRKSAVKPGREPGRRLRRTRVRESLRGWW